MASLTQCNNQTCISTKKYGQQEFDFDEGIMTFMAPNQVFGVALEKNQELRHSGWMLLVHPDFFWNTPLAKKIKRYEFFDYSVNEALFLSDKEETTIIGMLKISSMNIMLISIGSARI